jgi:hypothetical protein
MTRVYRHVRDFIDYLLAFKRKEFTGLEVLEVNNHDHLLAAKKLHAKVYLERGFVGARDVDKNDILTTKKDPYQGHSVYFLVIDKKTKEVIATARQILALPGQEHESFPLVKYTSLYTKAYDMISAHDPKLCVEISGLAKKRGASKLAPLLLYRAMWHYSLKQHHTLWLLTCDVRLFARLKLLFGPAILRVGRTNFYLGSDVVPAVLKVQSGVTELRHSLITSTPVARALRRRVTRFLIKGLPVDALNAHEKRALADLAKRYHIHP